MNTWNTLLESYQQRVYNITFATAQHQIQQAENPTPAVVISVETARVDNAIHHDYLTAEVAPEEAEIGTTDPNIPIDNNCMNDKLHSAIPGDSGIHEDEGDECDIHDAIPTASRCQTPATELKGFELGTSNVDGYKGEDGDKSETDEEEEEASQAND
jgi:hypothetical protein